MDAGQVALVSVAAGFALVNGANDGSVLAGVGLKLAPRLLPGIALLALAVVVVPFAVGTGVATTYAVRLVDGGDAGAQGAFAAAVLAAVVVTAALSRAGLPTSLTLGLLAGVAGAGLGAGLAVSWPTLALVLAVAALAPLGAALAARGVRHLAAVGATVATGGVARRLRRVHRVGFAVLAVAYGANDGQKMLAVAAVATGAAGGAAGGGAGAVDGAVRASPGMLAAVGILFAVGTVAGLARVGRTLDRGLLATRPAHAVAAELTGGAAALAGAVAGAPVSMTQAVAGGLIGSGAAESARRVRWRPVARLVAAWGVTLPAAFALAAGATAVARLL